MMWSWILACVGVVGTFFVGRKTIWGWVVLFFNECLWLVYATQTDQYGFYLGSAAYMAVYIRSYIHWSKDPINPIHHKPEDLTVLCYDCGGTYKAKNGEKLFHEQCIYRD